MLIERGPLQGGLDQRSRQKFDSYRTTYIVPRTRSEIPFGQFRVWYIYLFVAFQDTDGVHDVTYGSETTSLSIHPIERERERDGGRGREKGGGGGGNNTYLPGLVVGAEVVPHAPSLNYT